MQRYFVNDFCYEDGHYLDTFVLNEDDSYHIVKVMRNKIGDLIEVVIDGDVFVCKITKLGRNVECVVSEKSKCIEESIPHITIAQSLVKEQKMDYILQKSTELGVYKVIPLEVSRSVIKVNDKFDKKIDRWKKIVKEASEQSKRNFIPVVDNVSKISNLIRLDYNYKILCSVNELSMSLKRVLQNVNKSDTILIVIGPEGGFSLEEEKMLIDNGFISTSLGSRVLRTETASTFVLSIINYIFMR